MGLAVPLAAPISGSLLRIDVIGDKRLIAHLNRIHKSIRRMRTVGVDRAGKYLYDKKRADCKAGLYSGKEVAPNKWRYGWEYLGGPAKYEFTGSVLDAHELGKRVNAAVDSIEVSLNPMKSPHAAMIHGPMSAGETYSGLFYSPMLKKLVKTRPWMQAQLIERAKTAIILVKAYKGM